jgi:hypothetical protein
VFCFTRIFSSTIKADSAARSGVVYVSIKALAAAGSKALFGVETIIWISLVHLVLTFRHALRSPRRLSIVHGRLCTLARKGTNAKPPSFPSSEVSASSTVERVGWSPFPYVHSDERINSA